MESSNTTETTLSKKELLSQNSMNFDETLESVNSNIYSDSSINSTTTLEKTTDFKDIIDYWFPDVQKIPKFWFSKDPDIDSYIKNNYTQLLILAENNKLNNWKTTPLGHLALIVILDQFSRHVYRDTDDQYKNDIVAYQYALEFFMEKKDIGLTNLQIMMALMPFRHQEEVRAYEFVINYVKDITDPLWDNFKYHTMKNYQYLLENDRLPNRNHQIKIDYSKYTSILENEWSIEKQLCNVVSPVANKLIKFLIDNHSKKNINNLIIVSLSGGVDSMVILYILSQIYIGLEFNLKVVAVHLDYHNRPETGLEAEFLFRWCELMDIPLYYRYIHEGTRVRSSKEREEYEEMTKNIRFDMYKKVTEMYPAHHHIGVILGHHLGDLQENIFFNVMKGRTLTDLTVIKEQSMIMGVNILRPLISIPKSEIFDVAHKNNIPYFKNTTPSWSNRGKYREVILPSLKSTFGEGVLTNLSKIGNESDELNIMIKQNIINPYFETIQIEKNTYKLPKLKNQTLTFWKYVFHEFCHRYNLPVIPHKLITNIVKNINENNKEKFTCNLKMKIYLDEFIIIELS